MAVIGVRTRIKFYSQIKEEGEQDFYIRLQAEMDRICELDDTVSPPIALPINDHGGKAKVMLQWAIKIDEPETSSTNQQN